MGLTPRVFPTDSAFDKAGKHTFRGLGYVQITSTWQSSFSSRLDRTWSIWASEIAGGRLKFWIGRVAFLRRARFSAWSLGAVQTLEGKGLG